MIETASAVADDFVGLRREQMDPRTAFQAAILVAGSVSMFIACAVMIYRAAINATYALMDIDEGHADAMLTVDRIAFALVLVGAGLLCSYVGREIWPSADLHDLFVYAMAAWTETR